MSDTSSTQMTTEGPCSPIFGTATFSTLTATALTTMLPGSPRRSESNDDCASEITSSETHTYHRDDVTEADDDASRTYDDDSRTERSSPVDDTLSETSSSFLYPHASRGRSTSEDASSYSRSPNITHARSHSERGSEVEHYSNRSGSTTGSWSRRTAGELIAMFEGRTGSSRSSTPFIPGSSRSASPVKSTVSSGSQAMPGGLPAVFRRTGPPWASTSEYAYTYSSRPSSPTKSAVSNSALSSWSFSSGSYDASRSATESRSQNSYEHTSRPRRTHEQQASGSRPIRSGYIWYLNAHRLGAYRWQRAEAHLYPQVIIVSWISPDQGRLVVRLDLLSCLEVRTAPPVPYVDEETGLTEQGGRRVTARFDLIYDDSIERLGAESQEDMLDWFTAIQSVFRGTMTVDEYTEPPTPMTYISAPAREAIERNQRTTASTASPPSADTSSQDYTATFTTLTTVTPAYSSASGSSLATARTSVRTAEDTLSPVGTDIVASSLSYRDSSDASLLGDSCSYMTPRTRSSTPMPRESTTSTSCDTLPNLSSEETCSSPASAYETADAASPSASESFVSLPDISSFPDDDEDEDTPPLGGDDTLGGSSIESPEASYPQAPDDTEVPTPISESKEEVSDTEVKQPSGELPATERETEEEPARPKYSEQAVGTEEPQLEQEPAPEPVADVQENAPETSPAEETPAPATVTEETGVQA
ncbi:hypothetical protein NM688_g7922 [Phlebia brevispora]|uniref:Uncharacterized protein n=1 Tax=Phlebia brevispora TaxID=194682 RepID=A0ACC1RZS3_9APHY|nr:hypothetical protein NM688_g7922 [Phlebia brevispora]